MAMAGALLVVAGGAAMLAGSEDQPSSPTPGSAVEVPAAWQTHRDLAAGYVLAHPPDWQIREVSDTITDVHDPASSTYLRVD